MGRVSSKPSEVECHWSVVGTPVGSVLLVGNLEGLCRVMFNVSVDEAEQVAAGVSTNAMQADERLAPHAQALRELMEGTRHDFPFPVDTTQGTEFDRSVWNELNHIPWGVTRTYGEIAHSLGREGASRAVGSACGRNPLPIITPCHRVIGVNGRLGGYTGGLDIKISLLRTEGVLFL
jgi:methylated-DNA-[protein]-cysteine S-methyltransferase